MTSSLSLIIFPLTSSPPSALVGKTSRNAAGTGTALQVREPVRARSTSLAEVRELRQRIVDRRLKTWEHQDALGQSRYPTEYRERRTRSEPFLRWIRKLWAERAHRKWQKVVSGLWLRDVAFAPGANAWLRAVEEVQRPFPGTASWLRSCSAVEGGWGRWVTYGGGSYYPGFEHAYVVGGPMQFKYPTFLGMYRRALESVRARGFHVPTAIGEPSVAAWRSALGQALAAGWARYTGNDDAHWSASWGNGC